MEKSLTPTIHLTRKNNLTQSSPMKIIFKNSNKTMLKHEQIVGNNNNYEPCEYSFYYSTYMMINCDSNSDICRLLDNNNNVTTIPAITNGNTNSTSTSSSITSLSEELAWPQSPTEDENNNFDLIDDTTYFDDFNYNYNSYSDCKDPLLTDAVNSDATVFPSFSPINSEDVVENSAKYQRVFGNIEYPTLTSDKITIIQKKETTSYQFQHASSTYHTQSLSNQSHITLPSPIHQSNSTTTKIHQITKAASTLSPFDNLPFDISSFKIPQFIEDTYSSSSSSPSSSPTSSSSNSSSSSSSCQMNKKKPRLHLLQFIYCLLNSDKPNQCVCWVDQDNYIFRIINPNRLTQLWGRYKSNPNMSFDSLSRSLRLYYATGRLERVAGQRNQYRFTNREESIDFNRRNKRKQQHQPQKHHQSSSITTYNSSQHTPPTNTTTTQQLQMTRIPTNFTRTFTNKQPTSSLMYGSKLCSNNSHSLARRII